MRLDNLLDYLESEFSEYEFAPNSWKPHNADTSIVVIINGGENGQHVSSPVIQFLVRADSELQAEGMAYTLHDFFDYKTNFSVGSDSVILARGQQSYPIYTGTDNNDRFVYSVNIIFTVSKN